MASGRPSGSARPAPLARRAAELLPPSWRRHAPNAAVVAGGRVLNVAGTVVGVRLLTEFLPPETFGRYKLALAGVSLITGIMVRPFIQYAMRAWHDAAAGGSLRRFRMLYGRSFGFYVGAVSLAAALAGAAAARGGGWWAPPELVLAAAVLALHAAVEYDQSLCATRGRQRDAVLIGAATCWLIPVAIAVSAAAGESLLLVLAAHAGILALVLAVRRLRRREPDGGPEPAESAAAGAGPAWAFAWPLMIAGCLGWLVHESDRFILGYYHDSRAVGLYAAAYGLASAPFLVAAGAISQFMYPFVFGASARGGGTVRVSRPMLAATLLVGAAGACLFWLAGDWIAYLVLAERYRAAAPELLAWIAAGYACFGVATSFDMAAYGAKRTRYLILATGAAAIANVGLGLLLVPAQGARGAALATGAALAVYLLCIAGLIGRGVMSGAVRPLPPTAAAPSPAVGESAAVVGREP